MLHAMQFLFFSVLHLLHPLLNISSYFRLIEKGANLNQMLHEEKGTTALYLILRKDPSKVPYHNFKFVREEKLSLGDLFIQNGARVGFATCMC